jgi:hypothetical protein
MEASSEPRKAIIGAMYKNVKFESYEMNDTP